MYKAAEKKGDFNAMRFRLVSEADGSGISIQYRTQEKKDNKIVVVPYGSRIGTMSLESGRSATWKYALCMHCQSGR